MLTATLPIGRAHTGEATSAAVDSFLGLRLNSDRNLLLALPQEARLERLANTTEQLLPAFPSFTNGKVTPHYSVDRSGGTVQLLGANGVVQKEADSFVVLASTLTGLTVNVTATQTPLAESGNRTSMIVVPPAPYTQPLGDISLITLANLEAMGHSAPAELATLQELFKRTDALEVERAVKKALARFPLVEPKIEVEDFGDGSVTGRKVHLTVGNDLLALASPASFLYELDNALSFLGSRAYPIHFVQLNFEPDPGVCFSRSMVQIPENRTAVVRPHRDRIISATELETLPTLVADLFPAEIQGLDIQIEDNLVVVHHPQNFPNNWEQPFGRELKNLPVAVVFRAGDGEADFPVLAERHEVRDITAARELSAPKPIKPEGRYDPLAGRRVEVRGPVVTFGDPNEAKDIAVTLIDDAEADGLKLLIHLLDVPALMPFGSDLYNFSKLRPPIMDWQSLADVAKEEGLCFQSDTMMPALTLEVQQGTDAQGASSWQLRRTPLPTRVQVDAHVTSIANEPGPFQQLFRSGVSRLANYLLVNSLSEAGAHYVVGDDRLSLGNQPDEFQGTPLTSGSTYLALHQIARCIGGLEPLSEAMLVRDIADRNRILTQKKAA